MLTGYMLLVCTSHQAWAFRGHVFGRAFGSIGSSKGEFKEPRDIAVNEATGAVYVTDRGNDRVEWFSEGGIYKGQFNGSGEYEVEGSVETGAAAPAGAFVAPEYIAVDNSCARHKPEPLTGAACEAYDPSAGDVYVVDTGHGVIDKFTAAGEFVSQINEAGSGQSLSEILGVAVDGKGKLWVYQADREIDDFSDEAPNVFLASRESQANGFPNSGLAVDGEDNLYVDHFFTHITAAKLNSAGEVLDEALGETYTSAVAADLASDDVYVDNETSVAEFGPSGTLLESFGVGSLRSGAGLAIDASNEDVYVADSAANDVVVFVGEPPSEPTVGETWATGVTSRGATLHAETDLKGADTKYHFEYGTNISYGNDLPLDEGDAGGGFEETSVQVELSRLQPGTTYHYRVVATSGLGTVYGSDRTFTTQAASGEFTLPDGRAWELVSPPNTQGAQLLPIFIEGGVAQAAEDGDAMTYVASAPVTESASGNLDDDVQVLSTRGPDGWSAQDIESPNDAAVGFLSGEPTEYRFFSTDLSVGLLAPRSEAPLSPEASEKTIYLRDNDLEAPYRPLVTSAPGYANVPSGTKFGGLAEGLRFEDATPDLSHVVLRAAVPLTSASASHGGLYEWSEGALQLIAAETATTNVEMGYNGNVRNAISQSGSRVVYNEASGGESHLYLHDFKTGATYQLDAVQGGSGSGAAQPQFQDANTDDTEVFFTDEQRLTANSSASPGEPDLYAYDTVHNSLTDLTPDPHAGESADVQGLVLGASEDGSYIYYVANGALLADVPSGDCEENTLQPVAGHRCNLYAWHEGTTKLVATLAEADRPDWGVADHGGSAVLPHLTARVAPDGKYLAFMSEESLTGYDNLDAMSGEPDEEVFLYGAEGPSLACVSCDPTGARPVGMKDTTGFPQALVDNPETWAGRWLAGNVPGWTATNLVTVGDAFYQSKYLDNDGRLFFNSPDALVPADTNGREDVYEYEPQGVGSCTSSQSSSDANQTFNGNDNGCVALISSGLSSEESALLDASANGNDVFFLTTSRLAGENVGLAVYDAHVCGSGWECPAQPLATAPECESAADCRAGSALSLPPISAPASATVSGQGEMSTAPHTEVSTKPKSKTLSRTQKRARALTTCRRMRRRRQRVRCEARAYQRYGAKPKAKKSSLRGK